MKRLLLFICALVSVISASAQQQEQSDSLVILMSAKSAQMVDVEGASYRKVVGPARFLHNNTYLLCDTAYWNVDRKVIDAWGNVSVLQEETVLTSDKLTYLVDQDLAQFRGSVVQLTDKDHNTLRTRHLDYNTKDSIAVFQNGGSMRDKDGQIIESRNGTYDSKMKKFVFENDVNMFTDSIFVKTRELVYESDKDLATFGSATDAWQENNMLSSNSGWYDRARELFFFRDDVHVMSEDQEGWCDSLFFHRLTMDVEMLGNAQVSDTTRNVFALAGRIEYIDTLSKVTMTRKPAVISRTDEQDGSVDTVYLGADKLVYFSQIKGDVDSLALVNAEERLKSLDVDPVGTFRRKAAEEAAKAAEQEAMENDPNYRAKKEGEAAAKKAAAPTSAAPASAKSAAAKPAASKPAASKPSRDSLAVADSLALPDSLSLSDSLALPDSLALALADSLAVADSLAALPPKDSTKIGFLEAIGKVKIYKKNMQVVCDSLLYTDLDSLARLFKEPFIWQEVTRQYTADSITVVVRNNAMEKASLMSNAFITIEEDTTHYDQIKGAEMLAFFDDKGGLERFDVLGGASALFFIEENDALATVNKTDSKMLSATFKDGNIQRIYYFEDAKNDGYPVVQLSKEEQMLKGFNWQPERRPADRNAVTPLSLRPSERRSYSARPRTRFRQTDIYFPGYMNNVYRQIEVRDSLRKVRERERAIAEREAELRAQQDSLMLADSLMSADSLAGLDSLAVTDSLAQKDSLSSADSMAMKAARPAVSDSLAVSSDTASVETVLTPEEIKAAKKAEQERKKAEAKAAKEAAKKKKQEALEAKWAELDKRDAEKAAAKEQKALEKERERKRRYLQDQARQLERDAEALEKFRRKFEKQKARAEAKAAKKLARK